DLVPNPEPVDCKICFVELQSGEGVLLRECLHCFCRDLLREVRVAGSSLMEAELKCSDSHKRVLSVRPIGEEDQTVTGLLKISTGTHSAATGQTALRTLRSAAALYSFLTMAETKGKFDFAIDRGGTFTDVFARLPDGRERVLKLLSKDPQNYKDAPTEGIRRVLGEVLCPPHTSLCFSWSDHEKAVGSLARRLGFTQVSLSSEVMPMVRAVPRGYTVCADAYLTPKIHQYLKGFIAGFEGGLKDVDVLFMQSDGGLTPMEQFCGSRAILSGPAGGVVGYAITSYSQMEKTPVIGFDMGGECGPLTVTDANLALGRLLPSFFPKIFGPAENEPLSLEETMKHFHRLTEEINIFLSASQAKGHDTSQHVLACFGGAGGQHACAIARALGMKTVFIHKYSGVLSAYGLALADVVEEVQEPCSLKYEQQCFSELDRRMEQLCRRCRDTLCARGFSRSEATKSSHGVEFLVS
ncbi:hypothetical protein GOODEAATRI_017948, partial [Goodea atripinnis]